MSRSNARRLWAGMHAGMWEHWRNVPDVDESAVLTETAVGDYLIKRKVGAGAFGVLFECTLKSHGGGLRALASTSASTSSLAGQADSDKDNPSIEDEGPPSAASHACEQTKSLNIICKRSRRAVSFGVKVIEKAAVHRHGSVKQVWRAMRRVDAEIEVLRALGGHAHIVSLVDVRQGPAILYLAMEFAETDLYAVISSAHTVEGGLAPEWVRRVMHELGLAVAFMHLNSYCHLDLKPENVLLCGPHQTVKLCDFGVTARCGEGDEGRLSDFVGSCGFFAPELVKQMRYDGRLADSWSFGVVLFETLVGHANFHRYWIGPYGAFFRHRDLADFEHGVATSVDNARRLLKWMAPDRGPGAQAWRELAYVVLDRALVMDPAARSTMSELERVRWGEHALAKRDPVEKDGNRAGVHGSGSSSAVAVAAPRIRGAVPPIVLESDAPRGGVAAASQREVLPADAGFVAVGVPSSITSQSGGDEEAVLAGLVEWMCSTAVAHDMALVVTSAESCRILHANRAWLAAMCVSLADARGKTMAEACEGAATEATVLAAYAARLESRHAAACEVVHYRGDGTLMLCQLSTEAVFASRHAAAPAYHVTASTHLQTLAAPSRGWRMSSFFSPTRRRLSTATTPKRRILRRSTGGGGGSSSSFSSLMKKNHYGGGRETTATTTTTTTSPQHSVTGNAESPCRGVALGPLQAGRLGATIFGHQGSSATTRTTSGRPRREVTRSMGNAQRDVATAAALAVSPQSSARNSFFLGSSSAMSLGSSTSSMSSSAGSGSAAPVMRRRRSFVPGAILDRFTPKNPTRALGTAIRTVATASTPLNSLTGLFQAEARDAIDEIEGGSSHSPRTTWRSNSTTALQGIRRRSSANRRFAKSESLNLHRAISSISPTLSSSLEGGAICEETVAPTGRFTRDDDGDDDGGNDNDGDGDSSATVAAQQPQEQKRTLSASLGGGADGTVALKQKKSLFLALRRPSRGSKDSAAAAATASASSAMRFAPPPAISPPTSMRRSLPPDGSKTGWDPAAS